ncbi:differentially expressed in FDCP 6 homolog isoform X1 [Pomacea canaliculata]|uniref:differentially expressed in FDCP 6 homolog isoform X1 n=1 Tax=Pomacea canaliculata TaxID=400727 RepID=UPI000D736465|nr:differentially expressed in FDCP 6 homolog isoform X1 [Pomacea canaliculata]
MCFTGAQPHIISEFVADGLKNPSTDNNTWDRRQHSHTTTSQHSHTTTSQHNNQSTTSQHSQSQMDRQGLPGIEDLFREQERLAKKLSQEELNVLRRYVRRAVHAECESVVARMRFLQAAHDVNERHFRQALDMLQKDLTREKTVASEFKREFASLSRVLQAREQRHKDQQDIMAAEVRHSRTVAEEARKKTEELEALVQLKEKELLRNKDMVVDLEDELVKHKNCLQIKDEAERLRRDVLRLKVDNEALRKRLSADTPRLGGGECWTD